MCEKIAKLKFNEFQNKINVLPFLTTSMFKIHENISDEIYKKIYIWKNTKCLMSSFKSYDQKIKLNMAFLSHVLTLMPYWMFPHLKQHQKFSLFKSPKINYDLENTAVSGEFSNSCGEKFYSISQNQKIFYWKIFERNLILWIFWLMFMCRSWKRMEILMAWNNHSF